MAERLDVKIITPERVVFKHEADSVILPGTLGEMEVLPGHVAIFSTIKPGQILIKDSGRRDIFASGAGLLEVCANHVTLLVDSAEGSAEIDPAVAQRLIEEAEDKLKNLSSEDEEQRFAFETQLAAAKARIEVYERTLDDREAQHGFSRANLNPVVSEEQKDGNK
jgi:F-type H+-transporting ATPase subunit epsilon